MRSCTLIGVKNTGVLATHKKYVVRLTEEERRQLETLVRRGRAHTRKLLYTTRCKHPRPWPF